MEERENNTCTTQLIDCNEKEKNKKGKAKQATQRIAVKASAANSATANNGGDVSAVRIALFDFSVENFFRDMDTIVRLYGKEEGGAAIEQSEIQRMSSSVTFLRYKQIKFDARTFIAFNLIFVN